MAIWAWMAAGFAVSLAVMGWWLLPRSSPHAMQVTCDRDHVNTRRGLPESPEPAGGFGHGQRWGRWAALGLMLIVLPVALTGWWALQHPRQLDGFDDTVVPQDAHLQALLEGEHLTPPPSLPPDLFLTPELQQVHPLLASADRRWEQLDPAFVQRVLRVFKVMRETHGYEMVLLEGWRSPERQALLQAKGPSVTQAGPGQSWHQHGLAVDCAFLREGRVVISERDPWAWRGYQLYGEVAEQMGLTWGGRWKLLDLGHTEWRKPGVQVRPSVANDTQ